MYSVKIENLAFKYRDQEKEGYALNIKNLNIPKGQFVVIMGPSGAGKTTLAHSLNGLIPHFIKGNYSGTVQINDKITANENVNIISRDIGLVFQDFESQLFSTNVTLELAFGPENYCIDRKIIKERIEKALEIIDLKGFEKLVPATLSGGQKQRLAIGSVLTSAPNIICMDEPTTDLDPIGKEGIFKIANQLHKDKEITLIIIEHETEEALNADRLILMNNGEILKDGTPKEILRDTELAEKIGIMPLQIAKFFQNYSNDRDTIPLTIEEGMKEFKNLNLLIDKEQYNNILSVEEERKKKYKDAIIKVDRLKYKYKNGTEALKDVSLEIREGEFIAILGPNGGGKTTLAKHLNALLIPTSGTVEVYGKDTKNSGVFEIGKEVGYAFQNPDHQIFQDNVYDEVAFSPKIRGKSSEDILELVTESLEAVELVGYEKKDPFILSKGERQRVAVASILSSRPKVIILDEPTTGLDYKEQKQMMELIKRLNEKGHTIILITHTMWVVAEYVHRAIVISEGLIKMDDTVRNVFSREKELLDFHIKPPHIISFSNLLNHTCLSVNELELCTKEGI